jgi:hypothetical protein
VRGILRQAWLEGAEPRGNVAMHQGSAPVSWEIGAMYRGFDAMYRVIVAMYRYIGAIYLYTGSFLRSSGATRGGQELFAHLSVAAHLSAGTRDGKIATHLR